MPSNPTPWLVSVVCLASVAAAQTPLGRASSDAAHKFTRGPSISLQLVRAADGAAPTRLVIDDTTPGTEFVQLAILGGYRTFFRTRVDDRRLGRFSIEAELDVLGPLREGSYEILARVTSLPPQVAVQSVGIEIEVQDVAGDQYLLIPTFGGAEFREPARSIPESEPIETGVSHSLQMTAYYADDGSGVLMFARDIAATHPKSLRFCSARSVRGEWLTRFAIEHLAANANVGGRGVEMPFSVTVQPYTFDPVRTSGWFRAAKIYRSFVERFARAPGAILEKGRLETRRDVPRWMRELDLLVWEPYGWFPKQATVQNPLLTLRRLKRELGAENMLVGLWFWNDRTAQLGRAGTWLPHPTTIRQMRELKPDGIRFTGYTFPGGFDVKNPLFVALGLHRHIVEDRLGAPRTFRSLRDNEEITWSYMDVAAPAMSTWFRAIGEQHATLSALSGFYCDFPATIEIADFRRPTGPVGITQSSIEGYGRMLRSAQAGARDAGHDFVTYHESAYEWLIRSASGGQGAVGVIGRAFPGDDRSRGVPVFQAVYSGYTLFWPADERYGPRMLVLERDTYGDPARRNMSRLLAEGFTLGGALNSSEISLADGKLNWEAKVPSEWRQAFLHHRGLLQRLIVLRRLARPWLVYGEMLNSPVAGGDLVDMTLRIPVRNQMSTEMFTKRAVPTTAWRARDGSIRLVAANGGPDRRVVEVDLRRIGLPASWVLVDAYNLEVFRPNSAGRIRVPVGAATGRLLAPVGL